MATVIPHLDAPSSYSDRLYKGSTHDLKSQLDNSSTLYIGNLSFYTTEEQIYELFSKCGEIKRIIMGLDRNTRTPCGFCFVEYYHVGDAKDCMKYVNGTKLDERVIRSDLDAGFKEGRQFGRGRSGGQVRDEYRQEFDAGRGGWGAIRTKQEKERERMQEKERERMQKATYEAITSIPAGANTYNQTRRSSGSSKKRERDEDDFMPQAKIQQSKRIGESNPRFREKQEDEEDE